MRISFNYPCDIAVVTLDGDLTSWRFGVGEVVEVVSPGTITLEARSTMDYALPDGSVLLNVPLAAVRHEAAWEEHTDYV